MISVRKIFFTLVSLASTTLPVHCIGQTSETRFVRVSDTLFPDSRDWLLVANARTLSKTQLAMLREPLESAYRASVAVVPHETMEGPVCSFIQRALEPTEHAAFHLIDIDKDGSLDVVYAGSARCAEGDATVIWYGTANGFFVRVPAIWQQLLLRVSADGRNVVSVAQGCCGATTDVYSRGTRSNFREGGEIRLIAMSELPANKYSHALRFLTKREVKLRSSPGEIDSYDKGMSDLMRLATFGNVTRTYLPGASGIILGESTKNERRWQFVVIDEESDPLASHDPYNGVRAGWIPADQLTLIRK